MWKRSELKAPARAHLKKRYWLIVFLCLMMAFFCGEYSSTLTLSNAYSNSITNGTEASQNAQHHASNLAEQFLEIRPSSLKQQKQRQNRI